MFTVSGPYLRTNITHPSTGNVDWPCFLPPAMFPLACGGGSPRFCALFSPERPSSLCCLWVQIHSCQLAIRAFPAESCPVRWLSAHPSSSPWCSSDPYVSRQGAAPGGAAWCPEGVSLLEQDTRGASLWCQPLRVKAIVDHH